MMNFAFLLFVNLASSLRIKESIALHTRNMFRARMKHGDLITRQSNVKEGLLHFQQLIGNIEGRGRRAVGGSETTIGTVNSSLGRFYFVKKISVHYQPFIIIVMASLIVMFTVLVVFMCCKVYSCSTMSQMDDERAIAILNTMETRGLVLRPIESA